MNTATQTDLTVANVILEQLGGRRFIAMTGARNILGDATSLQLKIGRGARDGITNLRVELDLGSDTYTVTFYRIRGTKVAEVADFSMVHGDQLRSIFTSTTGFDTSL